MTVVTVLDSGKKKEHRDSIQIKVESDESKTMDVDAKGTKKKSIGKMELAYYFFRGAADGAWMNIGIFCLVFVQFILAILFLILLGITIYCLGCVLGFIASVFGAIFQEEVTWIGNNFKPLDVKIPNIDVRISDYTCFIIIVVLEILIASGIHFFCFRKFFISFKSLKTTESETFRQFGTDVSCWLLYYIQTPELLIHTFNYKNNLVDLNFRRLFVDLFFWIPMNAFVIFVTVWILIAAFLRCFKTKASTK